MSPNIEPELVEVGAVGVVVIDAQGLEAIHVVRGTIWATDAQGRDVIAASGDEVVLDGSGRIVISGVSGPAAFEHTSMQQMKWAA